MVFGIPAEALLGPGSGNYHVYLVVNPSSPIVGPFEEHFAACSLVVSAVAVCQDLSTVWNPECS